MGSNSISTSQKNSSDTPQLGKVVTVQIVTMLIAVVSMLIDGMMTGIFLGDDCLAAYGLTNPVNMLLVALGGLLASGAQVMGGRFAGRNDEEGLNRVLTTSVTFGFAGGLTVSILISLFIGPLCVALGAAAEPMTSLTAQYLQGIVFCLPALVIGQVIPSFLQIRNCRRQIIIAAFAQIAADVLLDYLNVTVFHGGLWGMAMATVISCYLYVILLLTPTYMRAGYRFSFRYFSFATLGHICRYGLLYLVYKVSVALMSLFLNRALSSHGGLAYLAANSIIFSIELIIGAFPSGFGSTTSMLIGVERGQRGEQAATQLCLRIVKLSVIVNIIQTVLVLLLAEPLVTMFSPKTAEVAQLGAWGLRLYVLSVLPNTVNYIVRNYEQSMDHTASAYLICLMNHIVLPVAAGLLLVAVAPIRYIWLCFVIGQGLCLIITWFSVNGKIALKEAR